MSRTQKSKFLYAVAVAVAALGRVEQAEIEFRRALALDELSPVAHYNLAIISELRGDREAAQRSLAEASRLGYGRTGMDRVIHTASEYLAKAEGSVPRREGM